VAGRFPAASPEGSGGEATVMHAGAGAVPWSHQLNEARHALQVVVAGTSGAPDTEALLNAAFHSFSPGGSLCCQLVCMYHPPATDKLTIWWQQSTRP
jgi:hypothetical protein